jgi:hypothetical protein
VGATWLDQVFEWNKNPEPARPASGVTAPVDREEPADRLLGPPQPTPAPPVDLVAQNVEAPPTQTLSLSIGSIEVVVDTPATPPPLPPPAPTSPPEPFDDPIGRLRRQYVTWPDGTG